MEADSEHLLKLAAVKEFEAALKYRQTYDDAHERYAERGAWSEDNPQGNKNKKHLQFRSMKIMERTFMQHLWLKWREMEGLPISEPYVFAIGGHDPSHLVQPPRVKIPIKKRGKRVGHRAEAEAGAGQASGGEQVVAGASNDSASPAQNPN